MPNLDQIIDSIVAAFQSIGKPCTASEIVEVVNELSGSQFTPNILERIYLKRNPQLFISQEGGLWSLIEWIESEGERIANNRDAFKIWGI